MLAELTEDPSPTPNIPFLLLSLDCVRLRKFPEATSCNCLHGTVFERGPRMDKGVEAATNSR